MFLCIEEESISQGILKQESMAQTVWRMLILSGRKETIYKNTVQDFSYYDGRRIESCQGNPFNGQGDS